MIAPIDQMSERSSASLDDCICSGAMYGGDPITVLGSDPCVWNREIRCAGGRLSFEDPEKSRHLHGGRPVGSVGKEEVRRLEVAVDDPARVRFRERFARLEEAIDGVCDPERAALVNEDGEIAPFQVLEDEIPGSSFTCPDVQYTDDMLAPDLDARAPLAHEAPTARAPGPAAHCGRRSLSATRSLEAKMNRREDGPHSADAEDLLDTILVVEDLARSRQAAQVLFFDVIR